MRKPYERTKSRVYKVTVKVRNERSYCTVITIRALTKDSVDLIAMDMVSRMTWSQLLKDTDFEVTGWKSKLVKEYSTDPIYRDQPVGDYEANHWFAYSIQCYTECPDGTLIPIKYRRKS